VAVFRLFRCNCLYGRVFGNARFFLVGAANNGVTVGTSLNRCYDTDWNTAAIKEGESELPEMIAIIERSREDRERNVVIDR
jgi:hypothetical protein